MRLPHLDDVKVFPMGGVGRGVDLPTFAAGERVEGMSVVSVGPKPRDHQRWRGGRGAARGGVGLGVDDPHVASRREHGGEGRVAEGDVVLDVGNGAVIGAIGVHGSHR